MSRLRAGTSVPNRNIFDVLLEWNDHIARREGELKGFVQYIPAVEGVLFDLDNPEYLDRVSALLWYWLDVVKDSQSISGDVAVTPREIMRALLHTVLINIVKHGIDALSYIPARIDTLSKELRTAEQAAAEHDLLVERNASELQTAESRLQHLDDKLHRAGDDTRIREELSKQRAEIQAEVTRLTSRGSDLQNERAALHETVITLTRKRLDALVKNNAVIWPDHTAIDLLVETFLFSRLHSQRLTDLLRDGEFGKHVTGAENTRVEAVVPDGSGTIMQAAIRSEADEERNAIIANPRYVWDIAIHLQGTAISPARSGYCLWALGTALEAISGVAVAAVGWESGSLVARLKIFIRNIWARDDVREVLRLGREAAVNHYLAKPTEEVLKLRAERAKLDEERDLLKLQREAQSGNEERRRVELDIKEKEEKLRGQQLDNSLKSVELLERVSALVKEGIVVADKVRIDVNELCYFLFDGSRINSGEDISAIESNGKFISRESNDS
jgi:hypothetical protein